jgi:hypothetical protein
MKRLVAGLAVAAVVAAGCSGGDDDKETAVGSLETPTFSANDAPATRSSRSRLGTGSTTTNPSDGTTATTTTATATTTKVAFDDPVGDATPGVGTSTPPPWTDLAGGSLERQGNAYRLIIRLGGEAPQTAPGPETMNIASFYDIDGDGEVDFEIWVNLGRNGWGPTWYDDKGNAAPGDRSNVDVVVDGDEVRLLFPDVMLDNPRRLRFSIASEYGRLATIGTSTARRDDAPDNDRAVAFP